MVDSDRLYLHDPDVYTDPLEFIPERYLKTETHEPEQDPRVAAFGFGRRYARTHRTYDHIAYLSACCQNLSR